MAIVHVGIDLAKNVFAVHGVDEHGRPALVRTSVARAKLHELIAALPPCTGPTTVTAMLAMIGNGHEFACGRQFAAWLGLTPGQYSSGGKTRLGRITKAGDAYLRTMLILGARAVLAAAKSKTDAISRWAIALEQRRGYWKAVVAIAAKNARMCWAMLARCGSFSFQLKQPVEGMAIHGSTTV